MDLRECLGALRRIPGMSDGQATGERVICLKKNTMTYDPGGVRYCIFSEFLESKRQVESVGVS